MRTLLLALTLFASIACADENPRRLDNLQSLADVWGRIYLFHPRVVADGLEWEKALVEAIPVVEAARNEEELVAAIEKTLLARIDDNEIRVFRKNASAPAPSGPTGTIDSRVIAPGIGLIAIRDPNVTADPKFLERFADAYRGLGDLKQLVVDLRWPDVQHADDARVDTIPRFFLERAVTTSGSVRRQHSGWNERQEASVYTQNWVVEAGMRMPPITERPPFSRAFADIKVESLPIIKTPTLFVINNHSAASLSWTLDVLQQASNVTVAWEKRGSTPRSPWATGLVAIGKEHEVYIPDSMLLSARGGFGFRADYQTNDEIKDFNLPVRSTFTAPKAFSFAMKFPPKEEVSDATTREQRIAGLIKIVTIVNRFNPHLEYASPAWKSVLRDRIARVEAAQSAKDYFTELRRATALLNDSHVGISHRSLVTARTPLPVELRSAEGRVVITNVAEGVTALKTGDEILSIDDKTIAQIETEAREVTSLSTPGVLQRNLWTFGRAGWGEKDSRARLVILRGGNRENVEVARVENPKFPPKPDAARRLDGNIGYINLFEVANMAELDRALEFLGETNAMIFDLRGYPKFWLTRDLTARLSDRPVRSTKFVVPIIATSDENAQTWNTMQYVVEPHATIHYRKPVAVLINENTQSMPEDFAIYLENAKRATFIGSQTAGTNGNVTTIDLPAGGRMTFTGMRVLFDDGTRFQNIGIVPDVVVKPTVEGLQAGRDEVLEKAIEFFRR